MPGSEVVEVMGPVDEVSVSVGCSIVELVSEAVVEVTSPGVVSEVVVEVTLSAVVVVVIVAVGSVGSGVAVATHAQTEPPAPMALPNSPALVQAPMTQPTARL